MLLDTIAIPGASFAILALHSKLLGFALIHPRH
jgi:hypothetical protein